MLDVLLLRLDAPMMSFGGTAVDAIGRTEPCPTLSMLTGLLANALGYDHRDADKTSALQERLRFAARRDHGGETRVEYQTVDLGQPHMNDKHAWTTRGYVETRSGGSEARYGTHQRYRHFLVDSVFTVALTVLPADEEPTIDALERALRWPARPLFLGRKSCIPSAPLVSKQARLRATTLREAVLAAEVAREGAEQARVWWPEDDAETEGAHRFALTDRRDWRNQLHVGRRFVYMKDFKLPEGHAGE